MSGLSQTHSVADSPELPGGTHVLRPETFDLWGSRLIEASAGTGKTWTIAALYLRLVLGHGGAQHGFERALRPPEILVMTFTRAATRELSERIRKRLHEAAAYFRAAPGAMGHAPDAYLNLLAQDYPPGPQRQRAAWALAMAADTMDDAAVHTIDAWCQRMLRQHAFDSGSLFDETLVANEEAMLTEAVHDYWRQSVYPLAEEPLNQVLAVWSGVDALLADMRVLKDQDVPATPGDQTLAQALTQATDQRAQAIALLKHGWDRRALSMQHWLDAQTAAPGSAWDGRKLQSRHFTAWLKALQGWADGSDAQELPTLSDTGWDRLSPEGLLQARKASAPALQIPPEFSQFAALKQSLDALPGIRVALLMHAAHHTRRRLQALKRQTSSFGFSDMLERLHAALQGENGERLRQRIRQQYPVALVDEFQDTSPLQYQILDRIYQVAHNDRSSAVLLIGDPKQSIYAFRGADIQSYMQARRASAGRHYALQTNFRATGALVDVVNHWFSHAERLCAEAAFAYRTAQDNPLPFVPVHANGRASQLRDTRGELAAMTLVHDLEPRNADGMRAHLAQLCAERIVQWLNDPQAGFYTPASPTEPAQFKRLQPADIAILVRTGTEATAVRQALERRAVASVYLSERDSVFDSPEARDLVLWLRAVDAPQDVRLARAAWASATLGLSLNTLAELAHDEEAFDARAEQLRQLRTVWQTQGVLAMLRQSLHQLDLAAQWLSQPQGERTLTNFLHLAELLQGASAQVDGERSLIRWLVQQTQQEHAQADEQVVRLESDADLVKVVTIHKSKGMEYPVVCLPYASSFREKDAARTLFVHGADAQGQRTVLLNYSKDQLAQAQRERLREDLRLLYVALTRAQHSVWIGFSALTAGQSTQCVSHKSGAGYVLGSAQAFDSGQWLQVLQAFAAPCADMVLEQGLAPSDLECTPLARTDSPMGLRVVPDYQAPFERDWSIGSFSRLAKDLSDRGSELSPLHSARPADDEATWSGNAPEPAPTETAALAPWHTVARGAKGGNFLHDQLEWLARERFALTSTPALAERLHKRCERSDYAAHATDLALWLAEVVQTPLPGPETALASLATLLPEMEFWLPARHMPAQAIDALCQQHLLPGVARPGLSHSRLHGMLMGFMDLVFEHEGVYWVLDYKSNHLGHNDAAYTSEAMVRSMAEHRYDVQAALYLLALHRLLKSRLGPAYQPEKQLGGALYLFLRGVRGPQSGVCQVPAKMELLQALDDMLEPSSL